MAKLAEIVYDVREGIKAYSDDSEIDNRYIIYLYNIKRAKYLRQDLNNLQKTNDLSIQQTFCVELEEVNSGEAGVDVYCDKILRTKQPVPDTIELHTKTSLTKIKPVGRLARPFNFITKDRVPYLGPKNKGIYVFQDTDDYLYIVGNSSDYKLIDYITVTGIFENPLDLKNYKDCCDCEESNTCFDEDNSEYPLQPHYVDLIRAEIIQELARITAFPEDKSNDSNDEEYAKK